MSERIRTLGLAKEYRSGSEFLTVLKDVTLTVRAGEMVAVVGASGVGKSTLLHLLGALDRPTGGYVFLDGEDVFARGDRDLDRIRSERIGFVFQMYNLLREFSALENAALPALIQRRPMAAATEAAEAALREMGLAERLHHRPGELSGGEQQRVAIARALVARPSILLADEPTGNLDAKASEAIFDLFLRLQAERGLTIVVVTHNERLARKAERLYRLVDGRTLEE